nr:MAG TPA: hypothetical protein [Caudoviricetes sp.]
MTTEKIIQDASQNKEIQDYTLLDMHLYLVIKQILIMYFNNQISKEQANKLKQKAVKEYEDNKRQFEFEHNMWKQYIENINKTENLRIRLRKQLNSNTEINEILNTCIELIQLYSKEEFI